MATAYFVIRALENTRWSWDLLAGTALGLAFVAKEMQARPVPIGHWSAGDGDRRLAGNRPRAEAAGSAGPEQLGPETVAISTWVRDNFPSTTIDGVRIYDLSSSSFSGAS